MSGDTSKFSRYPPALEQDATVRADFPDVPLGLSGVDHRLDAGGCRLGVFDDLDARGLGERFEDCLALAGLKVPAPRRDDDLARILRPGSPGAGRHAGGREQARGAADEDTSTIDSTVLVSHGNSLLI